MSDIPDMGSRRAGTDDHSGDWLAIMRIGAGLTLMAKVISEYGSLGLLYGSNGLIPLEVSSISDHAVIPTLAGMAHHLLHIWPEDTSLRMFFCIAFVFSALVTVGLFTRVSVLVCWFFQMVTVNSSFHTSYGYEFLLMSLLFYSLIFPCGRYFSLDRMIRGRAYPPDPLMKTYHLTLQFHVYLIYMATGLAKAVMPTWHDGSYLWSTASHPAFATFWGPAVRALLSSGHNALIMSWFIVILEIIYPLGILFRSMARPLLIFIILMHAYIALAVGLWIFGWLMIIYNLAAFGDVLITDKPKAALSPDQT